MKNEGMSKYSACGLCPRECRADRARGERGVCGESAVLRAARASLHFWEEPCLSGTRGSGTVFFTGCSLACVYCQNREISHRAGSPSRATGIEITVERLAEIFLDLEAQGAHNINLVTAAHFAPSVADAIRISRDHGLSVPIIYNSSGYESVDTLRMLDGLIDIYLPDCKYFSRELSASLSSAPDYFEMALPAIAEMLRQTGPPRFVDSAGHVLDADEYDAAVVSGHGDYSGPIMTRGTIVRHLMLPEELADSFKVVEELHHAFGERIYISLMSQYTPMSGIDPEKFPALTRSVSLRDYRALVHHAKESGVRHAFIQGGETAKDSFIPEFDGRGINQ